jgi:hypothetical protein
MKSLVVLYHGTRVSGIIKMSQLATSVRHLDLNPARGRGRPDIAKAGRPLLLMAGRSGNTWQIVNDGICAPAGGETISRSMSGLLKTGSASAIILLLTSAKKLLTAHKNCS